MHRRLSVLLLSAMALTIILSSASCLQTHRQAFTPELASQIKPLMTLNETERLMRVPAGNYAGPRSGPSMPTGLNMFWSFPEGQRLFDSGTLRAWIGDEGYILVYFDADERVTSASFGPVSHIAWHEDVWRRMRRLLGI